MSLKTLELKPDRLLLDSSFDGYKLSLEELKVARQNLQTSVDKTFLNSSQYGLLHAKLFGLHNHLVADPFDDFSSVYFVDQQFNVQKVYVDSFTNELIEPITVFHIPKLREQAVGDYNVTLRFAGEKYALLSDGMGTLYILDTKDKKDDDEFSAVFSEKVLCNEQQGFVIADSRYNASKEELHVLLLHIEEDSKNRFVSVIHWITFKKFSDWEQTALRQLKTKGEVQYLHLEPNCDHLYIVAENSVEFTLNSEPSEKIEQSSEKFYKWSQNLEEISIKLSLPENYVKEGIEVFVTEHSNIVITYQSETILSGKLEGQADLLTWLLETDHVLEITLTKKQEGILWKELIQNDKKGEYILDPSTIDKVNEILQEYTADSEIKPASGSTFNSQQIEECDFESDKSNTFNRINGSSNTTTHRVHLGSHQVILSPYLNKEWAPSLGIRHDVDICLWQPIFEGDEFICKHEGTLLAFGYVQASKTNRKYITCSPNLEYAVISEASGHIFIYQQNKTLLANELRHRSTGRRIRKVAQQQVYNLPNQEILGIFAGNQHLYLLGEDFVIALNITQ